MYRNIDPVSVDRASRTSRKECHATATHRKSVPDRRDETQLENKRSAKWKGQVEVIAANQLFNL